MARYCFFFEFSVGSCNTEFENCSTSTLGQSKSGFHHCVYPARFLIIKNKQNVLIVKHASRAEEAFQSHDSLSARQISKDCQDFEKNLKPCGSNAFFLAFIMRTGANANFAPDIQALDPRNDIFSLYLWFWRTLNALFVLSANFLELKPWNATNPSIMP